MKIHIFFNTQNNNEKSEGFDKNVHRGEGIWVGCWMIIFVVYSLLPKSYVENLRHDVIILGGVRMWLNHKDRALMSGISALIKEVLETALALLSCEDKARC